MASFSKSGSSVHSLLNILDTALFNHFEFDLFSSKSLSYKGIKRSQVDNTIIILSNPDSTCPKALEFIV